jgi:DNA-binding NtrC family response regulator
MTSSVGSDLSRRFSSPHVFPEIPRTPTGLESSDIERQFEAAKPTLPRRSVREIPPPSGAAEDLALDVAVRNHVQRVLDLSRGNKYQAAKQLGIARSTLYRLLADWNADIVAIATPKHIERRPRTTEKICAHR